jgi:hypothetical protein
LLVASHPSPRLHGSPYEDHTLSNSIDFFSLFILCEFKNIEKL